jgi:hypothetical protein
MAHIPGQPNLGHTVFDLSQVSGGDTTQAIEQETEQDSNLYSLDQVSIGDDSLEVTPREEHWYDPINNFFSGFNTTLSAGVQVPFDIGRAGHQVLFGGDVVPWLPNYDPDDPVAGASAINDLFKRADENFPGPRMGQPDPNSMAAQVGEEAAWNLSAAVPIAQAARATKFTYGWFEPVIDFVRTRPLTSVLIDLGISVPQGIGAHVGREWWGETGEDLGRIAGASSLLPVAAVTAATRAISRRVPNIGLTKPGREKIAGSLLEGSMTAEERAALEAGAYEMPPVGGPFTTGEALDASGLSRLRQSIIGQSEQAIQNERRLIEGRENDLVLALQSLRTDPLQPEARQFIAQRLENSLKNINDAVVRAKARAQARIDKLAPGESIDVASKMAREEIDKAYEAARAAERDVWSKIGDGRFTTNAVVQRAKEIIDATPRLSGERGQPDLPIAILEIAGKDAVLNENGEIVQEAVPSTLRAIESITEISALSSRINRDIREAYAQGKPNLARQLGQLRDSIYDLIVPVSGDAVGLTEARAYSKVLNDKFTRGPVGKLFQTDAKGALKVDPEMTLHKVVGTGPQGKIGVEKLRAASEETEGGTEAIDRQIQQHLLNKFSVSVMGGGEFNPNAAQRFVINNPALELYPELRAQMLDASQSAQLAGQVTIAARNRTKNIHKQSVASQVTDSEVPIRVAAILNSKNPIRDANSLLKLAGKDTTGVATQGVKSAFYDLMLNRMLKTAPDGRETLDPRSAMNFINNKTNRQVVKIMYGEHGLRLLDSVMKGMQYQARGRATAAPLPGVEGGGLGLEFAGNFGTVIGARLLGPITGHGLLSAGIGKRWMLKAFSAITKSAQEDVLVMLQKALEDPDFAKTLLTPIGRADSSTQMKLYDYAIIKEMMNLGAQGGSNLMPGDNFVQ